MAKAKKKRSRKRRGTQGGSVATRAAARPRNRQEARQRAQQRRSASRTKGGTGKGAEGGGKPGPRPASWRGAIGKGLLASVLFFGLFAFLFNRPIAASAALAAFTLAFYVPLSYYLDNFMYRRYERNLQRDREKAKTDGDA